MANTNTYPNSDGTSTTTLTDIQGHGLKLPSADFVNDRAPGKLEKLFSFNGNATTLYTSKYPTDEYLRGPLSTGTEYVSIERGQQNKTTSVFELSQRDGRRMTSFLQSKTGVQFLIKQVILQGTQPFDETKVYNPASPIVAAIRLATFGALNRPTRHIDTSNILGGVLGAVGLTGITRMIGATVGGSPAIPPAPRSTVASRASSGLSVNTLTSLVGGSDRGDEVMAPIARAEVRGLLRGSTATTAFNSLRYSRIVNAAGNGFLDRLTKGAWNLIQNNTLVGGIVPPKQPWNAKYRADEETYDYYLNAGKLFTPDQTGINGGGILSNLGFARSNNYSQAVNQRFYRSSKNSPDFTRVIAVGRNSRKGSRFERTNDTGRRLNTPNSDIKNVPVTKKDNSLVYSDLIGTDVDGNGEQSDQLLNYKTLVKNAVDFGDTFVDKESQRVKDIMESLNGVVTKIAGTNKEKYNVDGFKTNGYIQQFSGNDIGFSYLSKLSKTNNPSEDMTYDGRWKKDTDQYKRLTIQGRSIMPTNDVDYVNALEVMSSDVFKKKYNESERFGQYGPDFINFYFYDIVNQRYIPFNATVKGITDTNTGDWEPVEYLGRPDKLYYYKGFERQVNFSFTTVAHSVKELMPMWSRINYLTGLTRPANYTMGAMGGFMISPMVQLTLGDFYKNHNVVITNCNITIPDDASWETLPESLSKVGTKWFYGPNNMLVWDDNSVITPSIIEGRSNASSRGRYAQFPMVAEISVNMHVLEKDRPKTGRAIWGDAPVNIREQTNTVTVGTEIKKGVDFIDDYSDKSYDDASQNTFSENIRIDVDV